MTNRDDAASVVVSARELKSSRNHRWTQMHTDKNPVAKDEEITRQVNRVGQENLC